MQPLLMDIDNLNERVSKSGANIGQLQNELKSLREIKAQAREMAQRADSLGSAVDARTRAAHAHLSQRLRASAASDQAEHANIRKVIGIAVDEELTQPELASGTGSRFKQVITRADTRLQTDPHACLRRWSARLYELWGIFALRCVLFAGSLGLLPGLKEVQQLQQSPAGPGKGGKST